MKLTVLADMEMKIAATSLERDKAHYIQEVLAMARHSGNMLQVARVLLGWPTLPEEPRTLGIKETFLRNDLAVEDATGLEDIVERTGDRLLATSSDATVYDLWAALDSILGASKQTVALRSDFITECLRMSSTPAVWNMLLRFICGKMSNGVQVTTLMHALAYNTDKVIVNRAWGRLPQLSYWLSAWDPRHGISEQDLMDIMPEHGVPCLPQLCARVKDVETILKTHNSTTLVQEKLDGQRLQIHVLGNEVRLFNRSLKETTEDYPEIVRAVHSLEMPACILDGEMVAMTEDGDILPFGALQKRLGRKRNRSEISVGVVLYDIPSEIDQPYITRLETLQDFIPVHNAKVRVIDTVQVSEPDEIRQRLLDCHENGREGLVCKSLLDLPEPGGRTRAWVKLKPDYMESTEFGDTMDLVVIGFNWGKGKRHGKVGALWLGVYEEGLGRVHPISKVGTGFTDEDLDWWTDTLTKADQWVITDVYLGNRTATIDRTVRPEYVVEVRASELTKIDHWGGVSLRFPRYIRRRPDKTIEQSTMLRELMDTKEDAGL